MSHKLTFVLTLASVTTIVAIILNLYFVDNFGNLTNSGSVIPNNGKLIGTWGNLILIINIIVIAMFSLIILFMIYTATQAKQKSNWITLKSEHLNLFGFILIAVSMVNSILMVHLVENISDIDDIEFVPSHIEPGQNVKIRGHYGRAVVAVNSINLIVIVGVLGVFGYVYRHMFSFVSKFKPFQWKDHARDPNLFNDTADNFHVNVHDDSTSDSNLQQLFRTEMEKNELFIQNMNEAFQT